MKQLRAAVRFLGQFEAVRHGFHALFQLLQGCHDVVERHAESALPDGIIRKLLAQSVNVPARGIQASAEQPEHLFRMPAGVRDGGKEGRAEQRHRRVAQEIVAATKLHHERRNQPLPVALEASQEPRHTA